MFSKQSLLLAILFTAFITTAAIADGGIDDLQRLMGNDKIGTTDLARVEKHDGALRLTSNKDQLIRLEQDAASVVVNNPSKVNILLDSPRLLIVMPRETGATSFKVLNAKGEVILEKDVIISNAQPEYVRVRRMCASNDASCVPSAYYYCPDGCYEVTPVPAGSTDASAPPPAGGNALNAADSAARMAPTIPQQPAPAVINVPAEAPPEVTDEFNPIGNDGEPTGVAPPPAAIMK
jgi:hypothetical protein